ncbi:hypothetical protein FRB95_003169 [Tulasnella sp. JGI-2019a]|nr:hypothetical protein FRB95_003169 [Tulasnella sp. JGI-2019a]
MAITANNWSSPSRNIKLKLRSKQPQQSQQPSQQPGEPQLQRPLQPTMTGARAALRPPQQNQQAVNVSPGNGNLMVGQNFWEEWQRLIALETEKRVAQQLEEELDELEDDAYADLDVMEDNAYTNPDAMETRLKAHPGCLAINEYPDNSSNSNSNGEYIALGNHSDDGDDDSDGDGNDTNKKPIKMVLTWSPPATHCISASPHAAHCASKPTLHCHYSPEKHLGSAACHKSCQVVIMDPIEESDDAKDDIESDAIHLAWVQAAMQMPYPASFDIQETIINESWCAVAELGGEDTDDMPLKNEYISSITGVWTQLRGHLKSEVKPLVESTYGFIQEEEDPDIISQNTVIYKALPGDDMAYTCEDYKNVKFHWYNQIVMIIIHRICFTMSCSDGY